MNVLVAGAAGTTGRLVLKELKSAGFSTIAMVRDPSAVSDLNVDEVRKGDLEALDASVFDGIDAAIFAAGSGGGTGADKTILVDQEGAKTFADYAQNAGLKRIVVLSAKGADAPAENDDGIRPYMHAKRVADDYIDALDIPSTILRPVKLSNAQAPGDVELAPSVPFEGEVLRAAVARLLVDALTKTEDGNLILELGSGSTPTDRAFETAPAQAA